MRKLLISLLALTTSSVTLANVLDNGTYTGYLQQTGYQKKDSAVGNILNDQVAIYIEQLSALGATNGLLNGTIIPTKTDTENCITNAKFSARIQGIPIKASNIILTNCKYENGTFSGNYTAMVIPGISHKGVFSFNKN